MSFSAAFFLRAFSRRCTIEYCLIPNCSERFSLQPADDDERGQLRLRSKPAIDRGDVRASLDGCEIRASRPRRTDN